MKAKILLLLLLSFLLVISLAPSQVVASKIVQINADLERYNNIGSADWTFDNAWAGTGYTMARSPNWVYVSNRRIDTLGTPPYVFTIYRSYLAFNTSILADQKIKEAKLWLKRQDFENVPSTWVLKVQNWTDGEDGVENPNIDPSDWWAWDGIFDDNKAVLLNRWPIDSAWGYVQLDPSIINQTGYSYLCLRLNTDVDQIEPTESSSRLAFWWQNNASYLPYLEIKYGGKPLEIVILSAGAGVCVGLSLFAFYQVKRKREVS